MDLAYFTLFSTSLHLTVQDALCYFLRACHVSLITEFCFSLPLPAIFRQTACLAARWHQLFWMHQHFFIDFLYPGRFITMVPVRTSLCYYRNRLYLALLVTCVTIFRNPPFPGVFISGVCLTDDGTW